VGRVVSVGTILEKDQAPKEKELRRRSLGQRYFPKRGKGARKPKTGNKTGKVVGEGGGVHPTLVMTLYERGKGTTL